MATITESGVVSRSLGSYRDLLGERFRAAFGTNLSLDPETPQGEIIGIMAASLVELDEVVVGQSNAQSPVHSIGSQVDDLCALIGLRRRAAQHSTVTATLTGDANTVIPAGSRAATTDDDEFETTEEHTIGAGGTVDAELSAVEAGAVPARAGTLNRIVTRVPGWASITNAADATVGRTRELTSALRERLLLHPNRLQRGTQRALQSALLDAGADRVRIEENDTDGPVTRQALTIDAHGVLCIVSGGTDDAIAEAVKTKSLGASTSGR